MGFKVVSPVVMLVCGASSRGMGHVCCKVWSKSNQMSACSALLRKKRAMTGFVVMGSVVI